jgi:glycogen(starch) synthase
VIYNGLEMPELAPQPLAFDKPRLVCLGRVVEDKGFDLALRALPAIARNYPDLRLVVAGDGPARPALEGLAAELGIGDVVDFAGWISPEKVPELMNSATIVLLPSRWREAFGLVALQAAQMERPVVATEVGGLPEVVVDQETGLIVAKEDSEALAEAVLSLLRNPSRAVEMGQEGRVRAQQVFSWERHIDDYDALYQTLMNKGG